MINIKLWLVTKRARRYSKSNQPLYLTRGKTWKQINWKLSPLAKKEN